MILSIQQPLSEHTSHMSAREAFLTAKGKVSSHVSQLSLKNICYGASIVFSMMCVIHARKGKIITAATLAIFTEVAMFFASTKNKAKPNSLIKTENTQEESQETPSHLREKISYTPTFTLKQENTVSSIETKTDNQTHPTSLINLQKENLKSPDKLTVKELIMLTFLTIISMSR